MNKALLKRIWKHGSTVILVGIVLILLVPSWRVPFQGWFQSLFMGDLEFETSISTPLPPNVEKWQLQDIEGNNYLFENFLDKPIIMSFWATWCPPCRAELGELASLKASYSDQIYFISVSEESVETIKNSGLHESYDFLFSTSAFPSFFEVESYPTLCIINNNSELVFQHAGAGQLENEKNRSFLNGLIENQ